MTDLRHRTLLVRSASPPQPDGDGSARRLFHFLEFLRAAGCGVTCVTQGVDGLAGPLTVLGATVCAGDDDHAERLARAERFDWALLGCWNMAEPLVARLRAAAPATKIVVDAGDVRFRWHARRALQEADGRLGADSVPNTVRELEVYAAADAVLAASRADADLVADLIGDRRRTFVVPDSEDFAASPFPFRRRRGMFFAGDFAHRPDVDALAFLGDEILPHVDPAVLADNPLSVAGSHLTDEIRAFAADWPTVRTLGRVPSFVPYLERVRAVLVPPPHGPGARRNLIQSLSIGTPVVTTSVGAEGFRLADERELLVADDPVRFAAGITRLLTDEPLWNDLARVGRETIRREHGHAVASRLLGEALVAIRSGAPATRPPAITRRMTQGDYDAALDRARDAIVRGTPPGATVAVVSRGDEAALRLDGRTAWHFPLSDEGDYAGHYPATGCEAVDQLEAVRARGADFFAIPTPSAWWLGHYGDLRAHLETNHRLIDADGACCVLVSLREPPAGPQSLAAVVAAAGLVVEPSADAPPATIVFEGLSDRHAVTRSPAGPPPAISVVIATRNRGPLLAEVLDSLTRQTADAAVFEVVVVSDGSTDDTADVCRDRAARLRLTLVESTPSGIAVVRNLGIDAATAPLVLFLDDDAIADPGLVAAHLAAHRRLPLEHVAILGSTAWHPRLPVTELMRFLADNGLRFRGSAAVDDGQRLDHKPFLGGGSSCQKSLLVRAGGFRPEFTAGAEDLEAAHRICRVLARERPKASGFAADVGLVVVPCPDAVQRVIRAVTFDEVCEHCERQGRSQRQFSRVAADPRVDEWLGVAAADERWQAVRGEMAAQVARVHELERQVELAGPDRADLVRELRAAYAWTFDAFTTKGIVESAGTA